MAHVFESENGFGDDATAEAKERRKKLLVSSKGADGKKLRAQEQQRKDFCTQRMRLCREAVPMLRALEGRSPDGEGAGGAENIAP